MAIEILRNDSEMYVAVVTTAEDAAGDAVRLADSDVFCTRFTASIVQAAEGSAFILPSEDVDEDNGIEVAAGQPYQDFVALPGERINLKEWFLVTGTAEDGVTITAQKGT